MSSDPWVKFYPSDWIGGTHKLTAAERGVYITLIAMIYEADGAVPFDEARLARACGITKASFTRIFEVLVVENKVAFDGASITNRRAEREMETRRNRSEKARSSAHVRWGSQDEKPQQNQQARNANASATQCAGDANQKPEARSQKKEEDLTVLSEASSDPRSGGSRKKGLVRYHEAFERLWSAYPSRPNQSKAKAYEAWLKFDAERREGAVIAAPLFAQQCREEGAEPRFIPHLSTWLNERRFDEFVEYDDAPTEGSNGGDADTGGPSNGPPDSGDLRTASPEFREGEGIGCDPRQPGPSAPQGDGGMGGVLPGAQSVLAGDEGSRVADWILGGHNVVIPGHVAFGAYRRELGRQAGSPADEGQGGEAAAGPFDTDLPLREITDRGASRPGDGTSWEGDSRARPSPPRFH